jgi:hypothetical protein
MDKSKGLDKLDLGIDSRMLLEAHGIKNTAMLQQILMEIEGLLKLAPANIFQQTPEGPMHRTRFFLSWVGSAVAVVNQWDKVRGVMLLYPQRDILDDNPVTPKKAYDTMLMLLYEAQRDLRLRTTGPLNIAIDKGRVFDYFDELKEIIKQATSDLLFVDAYLDDEFVSRYLPHAKSGISIRLLTSG